MHIAMGLQLSSPEELARLAEQAKIFPVKRLPYRGERADLRFDRRTHNAWRERPIKALGDKELSWSDFQNGMHIKVRATANEMRLLYTPAFANNDEQLKLVVAQQAYSYIRSSLPGIKQFYGGERVPHGFIRNREALESLTAKALEARRRQVNNTWQHYVHLTWADNHGGYLALRATIAYKAWREAKDSTTIANEMGLNPAGVRQILNRMCETGRRLGLETFPRHHSCFGQIPRPFDAEKPKKVREYKAAKEEHPDEFIPSIVTLVAGQDFQTRNPGLLQP